MADPQTLAEARKILQNKDEQALQHAIGRRNVPAALALIEMAVDEEQHLGLLDQANEDGASPIHAALEARLDSVAAALARAGADFNEPNDDGENALHAAINHGMGCAALEIIKAASASKKLRDLLNETGQEGAVPLFMALSSGREEIAIALIMAGADLEITDSESNPPLNAAISQGSQGAALAIVAMLDHASAALDQADSDDGPSPILRALGLGFEELAIALADHGADLQAEDGDGNGLLSVAIANGRSKFIAHLIEQVRLGAFDSSLLDATDSESLEPILQAIQDGDQATAIALMEAGAGLEVQDADGNDLIALAVELGRSEFCAKAIELAIAGTIPKATLDGSDSHSCEAIIVALQGGHEDLAIGMLDAGANLDVEDAERCGLFALSIALGRAKFSEHFAQCALDKSINYTLLDATDSEDVAPIILALESGQEDLAIKLLEAGAELDVQNSDGDDLLAFSLSSRRMDFFHHMVEQAKLGHIASTILDATDSSGAEILLIAIVDGAEDAAIALLSAGANLAIEDADRNSPLALAIRLGRSKFTSQFIELAKAGSIANELLNDSDEHGNEPIVMAIENRDEALAIALMEAGADISVTDADRNDLFPLAYASGMADFCLRAAELSTKDQIARSFLDGANSSNQTALALAVEARDDKGCLPMMFGRASLSVRDERGNDLLCKLIDQGMQQSALAMVALGGGCDEVQKSTDSEGAHAFDLALSHMPQVAQAMIDAGYAPLGLQGGALPLSMKAPDPQRLADLLESLDPFKPNPLDDPSHPANHPAFHALAGKMAQARIALGRIGAAARAAQPARRPPLAAR